MYETKVKGLSVKVEKKSDVANAIAEAISDMNKEGWSHYETIKISTQETDDYFRVELVLFFKNSMI